MNWAANRWEREDGLQQVFYMKLLEIWCSALTIDTQTAAQSHTMIGQLVHGWLHAERKVEWKLSSDIMGRYSTYKWLRYADFRHWRNIGAMIPDNWCEIWYRFCRYSTYKLLQVQVQCTSTWRRSTLHCCDVNPLPSVQSVACTCSHKEESRWTSFLGVCCGFSKDIHLNQLL